MRILQLEAHFPCWCLEKLSFEVLYLTGILHSGKGYTDALFLRGRATKGNYTYLFYHNCQNVSCDYLIWILNGAFLVIEVFKITPVKTWKI